MRFSVYGRESLLDRPMKVTGILLLRMSYVSAGGSDYMSIVDEVIAASTMPNGVVSVNVSVFSDDRVELEETFSVVGRIMESGMITDGIGREFPVVFQGPLDVSIISDDGTTCPSCIGMSISHSVGDRGRARDRGRKEDVVCCFSASFSTRGIPAIKNYLFYTSINNDTFCTKL